MSPLLTVAAADAAVAVAVLAATIKICDVTLSLTDIVPSRHPARDGLLYLITTNECFLFFFSSRFCFILFLKQIVFHF